MTTEAARAWAASIMPAVIVPAAIGTELAAEARSRLEAQGYQRYGRIDRAAYDFIDAPALPELVAALAGIAEAVTSRPVTATNVRAIRLRPGDYVLTRHDRVYEDRPLELILDLSSASVERAEVHWRHRGQVFFAMKSDPGALAVVERGPTVMSNHLYVSKRQSSPVVRLIVTT